MRDHLSLGQSHGDLDGASLAVLLQGSASGTEMELRVDYIRSQTQDLGNKVPLFHRDGANDAQEKSDSANYLD